MKEILPVGSIISMNEIKFCIIGYADIEKDGQTLNGYYVVLYPLGYTGLENMRFIPADSDFEVLAEGYRTSAFAQYAQVIEKTFELASTYSAEEIHQCVEGMKKAVEKRETK